MTPPRKIYNFVMTVSGRCGTITYIEDDKHVGFGWEMSGASELDILLAPLDLRVWQVPRNQMIPIEEQRTILTRLREWLATKRLRTDIDIPRTYELSSQNCVSNCCPNKAITGSAYCLEHLSISILQT